MIPKKLKLEGDQGLLIGPQKDGRLRCAIVIVNIWIDMGEKEVLSQKGNMHDVSGWAEPTFFNCIFYQIVKAKNMKNYLPYP